MLVSGGIHQGGYWVLHYHYLLCLLSTVSGFKLVLGTLINLLLYFTKMQYTLRVTNKSEPSHFTASWVRSQQVKRKSPFSLPKGDRNLDNL